MKLPYREGDIFALPLGDGSSTQAQIVACGHHTVDVVARGNDCMLPAVRVSDRALVLHRWRRIATHAVSEAPAPRDAYWIGPARFERAVATRLGIAALELPPLTVRRGAAAEPSPHRLRFAGRNARFASVQIADPGAVRVVEFIGAPLERIDELAALPNLRALRIARLERFDIAALSEIRVAALTFESIPDLRGIQRLFERDDLRQLELRDRWSASLEDVMPLTMMPTLLRAAIDIGSRRKNVELNRRTNWAYPWPLDTIAELFAPVQ